MENTCDNCMFLKKQAWNMVISYHYSCKKEIPYKRMFKKNCNQFEPTLKASNTSFLRELHNHFTNGFKAKQNHVWRIVDDMTKDYKRISGDHKFFLCFETEKELDEFYSKHKHLIDNANLKGA
jgi:hypothetical protein